MRTLSILRIGIAASVTVNSASLVEVTAGRRRNRGETRPGSTRLEFPRGSRGDNAHHPRLLGVGLDNLKYGDKKVQHHKESKSKGKGKGGENYDSNYSRGKGKGYATSYGKGVGKGYSDPDSMDSEDLPRPSPVVPPSPKSGKLTHHRKEYKSMKGSKQTKLRKSEKRSHPRHPSVQPTSQPTTDNLIPSPSHTPADNPSKRPPSTSSEDDITGLLTPYTILYTVTNDERPPFRSELLEVVELTRRYLDSYFYSYYKKSEITNLSKVMTLFTNTAFEFGEAIPIDYESKAVLESSSIFIPDKGDLDKILASAFEGDNLDGYIGLLQSLPPSNIFSSTQYARLIQMTEESASIKSEVAAKNSIARNVTLGSIVVGGFAGLVLIFASTKIFRQKTRQKTEKGVFGSKSSTSIAGESFTTCGSRQDDRMIRPICDELYNHDVESRRYQ